MRVERELSDQIWMRVLFNSHARSQTRLRDRESCNPVAQQTSETPAHRNFEHVDPRVNGSVESWRSNESRVFELSSTLVDFAACLSPSLIGFMKPQ